MIDRRKLVTGAAAVAAMRFLAPVAVPAQPRPLVTDPFVSGVASADPVRLRLALTSCQHWEQGWFSAYRDMIAAAPDLVVQVGDYIYEKSFGAGPNVRSFGVPDR